MVNGQGSAQPPVQRGASTALVDDAAVVGHRAPTVVSSRWQRARVSISGLFPDPSGAFASRRGLLLALLAVIGGAVVSLLRTTGTGPLQSIWEEDARDILNDALNTPGAKAIIKPVAGYYVVFPRLLGELASLFPISWDAAVLSISAALVTALLAVAVYVASGAHFRNPLARFLVSAPLLAAPAAENFLSEIYNRPVGLHFFAMYALFWLLLWTPSGKWGKAGLLTTVGMMAFSSILIVGYLPLALARLYVRRDRLSLGLAVLTLAGSVLQLNSVMHNGVVGRASAGPKLDPMWAVATYLFWVVPNSILGFEPTKSLTTDHGGILEGAKHHIPIVAVSLLIPILVLVVAIIGARRGLLRPRWLLGGVAAAYSVWLHVFMVSSNGGVAMRYVAPVELLIFAAMVTLLIPARRVEWPRSGALLAALGVFILVVCAVNYRFDNTYRNHAPVWADQIRQAAKECRRNTALSHVIVRGGPQPFWSIVAVPCHDLIGQTACPESSCEWLDPPQSLGRPREATLELP